MMRRCAPLTASLLLAACAPEDAPPDDLVDPMVGLFADLQERDVEGYAAAVHAVLVNLSGEGPFEDRTFAPAQLTPDRVVLPDDTPILDTRTRLAMAYLSSRDIDDHRRLTPLSPRECVESPWTTSFVRTFDHDAACWANGACRDLTGTAQVTQTFLGATFSFGLQEAYVRVEFEDEAGDDAELWVHRWWMPSPATVTGAGADLQALYGLRVWTEDPQDPTQTWRMDAIWAERFLPDSDQDDTQRAEIAALRGMLDRTEAWFDAGVDACDAWLP